MRRVMLFGIGIASASKKEVADKLISLCAEGGRKTAFYFNAHCVNIAASDKQYKEILNGADLVYAGGMGLVWASRFLGSDLIERSNILDFFGTIRDEAKKRSLRFFLLGDRPAVVAAAAAALKNMGLNVVGFSHGYVDDDGELINRINSCAPDILMVGMGVPRQEKWIGAHKPLLKAGLCWGVGGVFKLFAGRLKRAPGWMIRCGLEWLFLGLQDPGRMAGRYLLGNPIFIARVLLEKLRAPAVHRLLRFIAAAVWVCSAVLLVFLLSARSYSHLICWHIGTARSFDDLYRSPQELSSWLRLDETTGIPEEADDIPGMVGRMKARVDGLFDARDEALGEDAARGRALRWDSPEGLARQIKAGARGGHCFHRAILLSGFCAAEGIPVRLWALENADFDGIAHTVVEFYDARSAAWVFCDPTFGAYAVKDGRRVSFLELRRALLDRDPAVAFTRIEDGSIIPGLAQQYRGMVRLAFLRASNDFTAAYRWRYGIFFPLRSWIDSWPDGLRMGVHYLFAPRERFIQYVDRHTWPRRAAARNMKAVTGALIILVLTVPFFVMNGRRRERRP